MWMSRNSLIIFTLLTTVVKLSLNAVSCPSGDTAGVIRDGQTCSELVAADNAECYDASFETSCCASCNAVATSNQDCLYGDKAVCFTFLCPSYTDLSTCCDTCAAFISTSSATPSTSPSTSTSTSTSSTSTSTSTSTSSSTSSTLTSSTSATTASATSSTSPTSVSTGDSSSNGGVIVGAVIGSIVGVCFLACGAFIAIKLLKKKDNQVADDTSSGIPEKVDKNSGYIPEKLDICTVLQEKLDTNSAFQEKAHPVATEDSVKTNDNVFSNTDKLSKSDNCDQNSTSRNNIDDTDKLEQDNEILPNNRESNSELQVAKPKLNDIDHKNIENHVNNVGDVDSRRQSLPPLRDAAADAPPIHERLPPIGVTINDAHSVKHDAKSETIVENYVSNDDNQLNKELDNGSVMATGGKSSRNSRDVSKHSNFVFPSFM